MICPACHGYASADLMNLARHIMEKSDEPHTDWLEPFKLQGLISGNGGYDACRSVVEILKGASMTEKVTPPLQEKEFRGTMKEYECVEVSHHNEIAKKIEEYIMQGWRLHTYQATAQGSMPIVVHYLLFERG